MEEDKRVFSSHDGTLYFSALEKIDNGFYSCTVQGENSGSSKGKNGPVFLLEVKPSRKYSLPEMLFRKSVGG